MGERERGGPERSPSDERRVLLLRGTGKESVRPASIISMTDEASRSGTSRSAARKRARARKESHLELLGERSYARTDEAHDTSLILSTAQCRTLDRPRPARTPALTPPPPRSPRPPLRLGRRRVAVIAGRSRT